jgi:exopolysaccharide biosynthesis polyprenyl glycosylphosphotransferase
VGSYKAVTTARATQQRRRFARRVRQTELTLLLALVDVMAAASGAWGSSALWSLFDREYAPTAGSAAWQFAFVVAWFTTLRVFGGGDLLRPRLGRRSIRAVLLTTTAITGLVLLGFYVLPFIAPRGSSLLSVPVAAFATLSLRFAYLRLVSSPLLDRRLAFIGSDDAARRAAAAVLETQEITPYRPVAFVDPASTQDVLFGAPVLRADRGLWETLRELDVDLLVIGHTHSLPVSVTSELVRCFEHGVEAVPATTLYEELTGRVMVAALEADWYAELPTGLSGLYAPLKRLIDVTVAAVSVILLPVAALVMVAIFLDSGRPIFIRQIRVGQRGEHFVLHKFRTMRTNAEDEGEPVWALQDDPRRTRVGRILRLLHLDELPQLWDVVLGRMSLIGPRPERPEFVDRLSRQMPLYHARALVRPGITGWAQVLYPYAGSVEENLAKLEYDLYYVRHFGLLLDLSIALRTIAMLLGLARPEYAAAPGPTKR